MMSRSLRAAGAATAMLVTILMLAWAGSAAAATVGPPGNAFYTPPSTLPAGGHGTLIWYRSASVNLGAGAPAVNADTLMYETEDGLGQPDIATGTVLVPTKRWRGKGSRPVIDYAPGTQGIGQGCEPSTQLIAGTEYETPNLVALLQKGWAVVLTDYQGYTTGSSSLYIIGQAEGHAVLDADVAADQVPNVGISATAPTAIWGYSQGGGSALWAATLAPKYDSSLDLTGVAVQKVRYDPTCCTRARADRERS